MECKEVKKKKRANTIFMEKLKEKQESKHITVHQPEQSTYLSACYYPV